MSCEHALLVLLTNNSRQLCQWYGTISGRSSEDRFLHEPDTRDCAYLMQRDLTNDTLDESLHILHSSAAADIFMAALWLTVGEQYPELAHGPKRLEMNSKTFSWQPQRTENLLSSHPSSVGEQ
jgi:hypothetical protein